MVNDQYEDDRRDDSDPEDGETGDGADALQALLRALAIAASDAPSASERETYHALLSEHPWIPEHVVRVARDVAHEFLIDAVNPETGVIPESVWSDDRARVLLPERGEWDAYFLSRTQDIWRSPMGSPATDTTISTTSTSRRATVRMDTSEWSPWSSNENDDVSGAYHGAKVEQPALHGRLSFRAMREASGVHPSDPIDTWIAIRDTLELHVIAMPAVADEVDVLLTLHDRGRREYPKYADRLNWMVIARLDDVELAVVDGTTPDAWRLEDPVSEDGVDAIVFEVETIDGE